MISLPPRWGKGLGWGCSHGDRRITPTQPSPIEGEG